MNLPNYLTIRPLKGNGGKTRVLVAMRNNEGNARKVMLPFRTKKDTTIRTLLLLNQEGTQATTRSADNEQLKFIPGSGFVPGVGTVSTFSLFSNAERFFLDGFIKIGNNNEIPIDTTTMIERVVLLPDNVDVQVGEMLPIVAGGDPVELEIHAKIPENITQESIVYYFMAYTDTGLVSEFELTQPAANPYIRIDKNTYNCPAGGGSVIVELTSNDEWELDEDGIYII